MPPAEGYAPPFQAATLEASMLPFYPNARLISLGESGHYPMQEQPPLLATAIECGGVSYETSAGGGLQLAQRPRTGTRIDPSSRAGSGHFDRLDPFTTTNHRKD